MRWLRFVMLVVGLCAACVLMYRQGGGDNDRPVVMQAALSIQHDMHDGWYFEATNMDVLMEVTCFCPAGVKVTPEGVQAGLSAPGTMSFK